MAQERLAHGVDGRLWGNGGKDGVVVEDVDRGHRLTSSRAVPNRRPKIEIVQTSASPEEAAAVAAAIEHFMRATAPPPAPPEEPVNPWVRTALLEGVEREPGASWI
jgi:hypothetical protein